VQHWSYAVVAVGGAVALLYLTQLLFGGALARSVAMILAIAWSAGFALLGFRKADEFNRERSKFAWYWGSFLAIPACVLMVTVVRLFGLPQLAGFTPGDHDTFRAFSAGVALPLLVQVIAYGLVSLWWRATKR